jgi:hypothetical protein
MGFGLTISVTSFTLATPRTIFDLLNSAIPMLKGNSSISNAHNYEQFHLPIDLNFTSTAFSRTELSITVNHKNTPQDDILPDTLEWEDRELLTNIRVPGSSVPVAINLDVNETIPGD